MSERKPLFTHYLGTSFGVTKELFNFWKKSKFLPIYLRQTANELTGEHTCLMLRPLNSVGDDNAVTLPETILKYADNLSEESWASAYTTDFRKRMLNLLGYEFHKLPCSLALALVNP